MKHLISALLLVAAVQTAGAYNFESNGLYYDFVSVAERTVSVVAPDEGKYSGDIVIPDSVYYNGVPFAVTTIAANAFYQATELATITFPKTLRTINQSAFSGCTSLQIANFAEGLDYIGQSAFSRCSVLQSVVFFEGLTKIDDYAFEYCSSLTEVVFPASLTEIRYYAFQYCDKIESLTIPANVTSLGYWAFQGAKSLKTLVFEDGDKDLYTYNAIYAPNLQQFYVGRNLTGDWDLFWLADYDTNKDYENRTLKYVEFGNTVTSVRSNLLRYTYNNTMCANRVETLILGENIKNINEYAFDGCTKIKTLALPDAIVSIGNYAFNHCESLETLVLGASLTTLSQSVFGACENIRSITARMEEPRAFSTENTFTWSTYLNSTLYVPTGSKANYTGTAYWSNFLRVEEGEGPTSQRYMLNVSVNGGGKATVMGRELYQANYSAYVEEGSSVTVTLAPDARNTLKSVTLNGEDVTASVNANTYTLRELSADATLRIEFSEIPMTLTLRNSNIGSFVEQVAYGARYSYRLVPDGQNLIHSVMFNDVDVTADVDGAGYYTTPAIMTPSTLTVIFEETGAGIESLASAAVRIAPTSQGIRIQGAERGTRIAVYDADGRTVASCLSQGGSDAVALAGSRTYVIAVGERTFKVRL